MSPLVANNLEVGSYQRLYNYIIKYEIPLIFKWELKMHIKNERQLWANIWCCSPKVHVKYIACVVCKIKQMHTITRKKEIVNRDNFICVSLNNYSKLQISIMLVTLE